MVEEAKILEKVTLETSSKGFSVLSLVVMSENTDFLEKCDPKLKQIVAKSLVIDLVQSVQYGSIGKLKQSVRVLAERLDLD